MENDAVVVFGIIGALILMAVVWNVIDREVTRRRREKQRIEEAEAWRHKAKALEEEVAYLKHRLDATESHKVLILGEEIDRLKQEKAEIAKKYSVMMASVRSVIEDKRRAVGGNG